MGVWYLSNTNSDLGGGADFNKALKLTTEGENTIAISVAKGATETSYAWTDANIPNNADWQTGSITVKLDVHTGNQYIWVSVQADRVSAAGAVLESSNQTAEQNCNVANVYTFTIDSKDWTAGNKTDRLRIRYIIRNARTQSAQSFTIATGTADATISAPINLQVSFTESLQYCIKSTVTRDTIITGSVTFTTVETTTWAAPGVCDVEYLVVGGGGGGSGGTDAVNYGAGGAGGCVRTGTLTSVSGNVTVTVGAGGRGSQAGQSPINGGSSVFDTVTAPGGGSPTISSRTGGSNADYSGGTYSSNYHSGGGAGAGFSGATTNAGNGVQSDLSGTLTWYGGGGGGGYQPTDPGAHYGGLGGGGNGAYSQPGTNGLGGGGGGCGAGGSNSGGSGIVIIHYAMGPLPLTYYISGSDALAFKLNKNLEYTVLGGGTQRFDLSLTYYIEHTVTKSLSYYIAQEIHKSLQYVIRHTNYVAPPFTASTTFTTSGQWMVPTDAAHIRVAVIAGGGGGGQSGNFGGGGGAGGYREIELDVAYGDYHQIIVGTGGAVNANGTDSKFDTIISTGGGRGGAGSNGGNGGSGGGAANGYVGGQSLPVTDPVQGHDGGPGTIQTGGGGGAGAAGTTGGGWNNYYGGNGGNGVQSDITGTLVWYAGGGAGRGTYLGTPGQGAIGHGGNGGYTGEPGTIGANGAVIIGWESAIHLVYRIKHPVPISKSLTFELTHKFTLPLTFRYITTSAPTKQLTYNITRLVQLPLQFAIYQTFRVLSGPATVSEFKNTGTVWFTPPTGSKEIEYLVIGGGGGGGYANTSAGGGAGGVLQGTIMLPKPIAVTVGSGGANNASGTDSSLGTLVIAKGGGHGSYATTSSNWWAESGGSGGGGCNYYSYGCYVPGNGTPGQGFRGGYSTHTVYTGESAGGGGAGGVGGDSSAHKGGDGGIGIESSITGTPKRYGGGGGGGCIDESGEGAGVDGGGHGGAGSTVSPTAGAANTGGGGGSGGYHNGAYGGSGYVVLKYPTEIKLTYSITQAGTTVIPISFQYTVKHAKSTTLGLKYTIPTYPPAKTKTLKYSILHKFTNSLLYWVNHIRYIQKSVVYRVRTFPRIQKTLSYEIVRNRGTISKYLTYNITKLPPSRRLDKYLTYDVYDTHFGGRITKTLQYVVKGVPPPFHWIFKGLTVDVRQHTTTVGDTRTLVYATKAVGSPYVRKVTKPLAFVIAPASIRVSVVSKVDLADRTWVTMAATPNITWVQINPFSAPTWYWEFGDGTGQKAGAATTSQMSHGYITAGSYSATAHAYLGSASCSASVQFDVEERSGIYIWFEAFPVTGTFPLTVQFTNLSTCSDSGMSYKWYFGDNGTSTERDPVHTYTWPGSYDVTLYVYSSYGQEVLTRTKLINDLTSPVANFEVVSGGAFDPNGYKVVLTVTDILGRVSAATKYVLPDEGSLHYTTFRDLSTGYIKDWKWDYGDQVEEGSE